MIFKLKLVDAMKAGRKTEHRIPVNGHTTDEHGICKVKPARPYPIQTVHTETEDDGYGKETRVRVVTDHGVMLVAAVVRKRLADISIEEAAAEGFARKGFGSRELFFEYWEQTHGPVRDQAVWVISFEADLYAPRFLRVGNGYTLNLAQAIDPLPVVPSEEQARFTAEAKTHDHLRAQKRLDAYDIAKRYAAARAEAERLGIDIAHHERAIKERLARIERANQQRRAA